MLFFIAERLHMSVVVVQRMSMREVRGWVAWFDEATRHAAQDDALDPKTLTKQQLRGMFK